MDDTTTSLQALKTIFSMFVQEREWQKFHTPKNLVMALSQEVAELMELFTWCTTDESNSIAKEKKEAFEQELADVFSYCIALANATNTDLAKIFLHKMEINKRKYPADMCKGKSEKYNVYVKTKNT